MRREEQRLARFREGLDAMGAPERDALKAAMEHAKARKDWAGFTLVTNIAAAAGRSARQKESNARTEKRRRKLVGARLPLDQAARCASCAALLGLSRYRFASDALLRACRMVEAQHGLTWHAGHHQTEIREREKEPSITKR